MSHNDSVLIGNSSAGEGLTRYCELREEIGPIVSATLGNDKLILRNERGEEYVFDHLSPLGTTSTLACAISILLLAGFIRSDSGVTIAELILTEGLHRLELVKKPNNEIGFRAD